MKAMQCELCGSTDILKDGDYFVCQNCGTKYTPENAKKMMVEGVVQVEGTVKIDSSKQIANYLELGNKACEACNYEEAEGYANKVLEQDNNNFEAWLIKGRAAGWQSTIGNQRIGEAFSYFAQAIEYAPEEKHEAVKEYIKQQASSFCLALVETGCNNAKSNPLSTAHGEQVIEIEKSVLMYQLTLIAKCAVALDDETMSKIASTISTTAVMLMNVEMKDVKQRLGDALETAKRLQSKEYLNTRQAEIYSDYCDMARIVAKLISGALAIHKGADEETGYVHAGRIHALNTLIEYDTCSAAQKDKYYEMACESFAEARNLLPESEIPTVKKPAAQTVQASSSDGGCYVATAVYGSYDCPQVWTLRRYRDFELAESFWGRAFIKTYYAISPTLVKWFGETDWFKRMWRGKLDRMVSDLQARGFSSAPYKDRNW